MAPLFSVIIGSGRPDLRETLLSLAAQACTPGSFEVIVISELANQPDFADFPVQFIPARDSNPAYKRNLGARQAQGDWLAFIDDDAVAPPTWLADAARFLAANPGIAALGGPNLIPPHADRRESLSDALLTLPLLGSGHPAYRSARMIRDAKPGDLHLVNLFVRRAAFLGCGGLNESIGYGGEDTEFIFRLGRQGGQCLFSGTLAVLHHRRRFGASYLKQRFRLRLNNGRLCLAYPGLYARKPAFWVLTLGPPIWAGAAAISPPAGLALAALYLAGIIVLSWAHRPRLFPLLPPAVVLHHVAYAAGFYAGLIDGLLHPARIRRIRAVCPLFPDPADRHAEPASSADGPPGKRAPRSKCHKTAS